MTISDCVILSTISAKEALIELAPLFEDETGHRLVMTYAGGPVLVERIRGGLAGDAFIGPDEFNEPLLAEGRLVPGSRVPFALSRLAVAIRAGAAKPDISTAELLKHLLLAASSVCCSRGASATHFTAALERLGIADAVSAKLVRPKQGELVGAVVARGEAEIGVQQLSELLPVSGIEILGALPGTLQTQIVYAVSLMTGSHARDAVQAFAHFMRSEMARTILRKKGLDPV